MKISSAYILHCADEDKRFEELMSLHYGLPKYLLKATKNDLMHIFIKTRSFFVDLSYADNKKKYTVSSSRLHLLLTNIDSTLAFTTVFPRLDALHVLDASVHFDEGCSGRNSSKLINACRI